MWGSLLHTLVLGACAEQVRCLWWCNHRLLPTGGYEVHDVIEHHTEPLKLLDGNIRIRGRTYTPTQLGEMLDPKLSPQKVNMILYKMGYQTLDAQRNWVPTDKAKGLYEFYDVAKTTDSGVPIKQLKWFSVMFDHIMNFIASSRQQPVIAPPQAPNLFGTSTQH
jgi:hypothetical protein